jgi:hypothetical protein
MPAALRAALISIACLAFLGALIWLLRRAKRGGRGMQAAGMAMMMLFGWATLRDPRNDTVAEAPDGRIRKGNQSGDPE